ncbi:MAG: phosphatidate cytidylyltransferase [Campylobacterota bacterium]|nr:phosphatidate cytidylyltransferase [Campylobacterota bacterium]
MSDIISGSSTRIKTGVALLVAFLVMGYIDSFFLTWFMFGLLMVIALSESMNLFKIEDEKIYFYAVAVWIVAYFYPKPEDLVFVVGVIFASILAYTKEFNKQLFLPLMYPIVSYLFLLSLYISFGMESLLWLVAVVAGTDIGAYFVGKSVGKTQFCATSPNKTLEGVFGGIFVAAVLGIVFSPDYVGFFAAFFISLIVAASSVFGDLFESYLKREADVKDSGDILPGHGGILDRSDGYLFGGILLVVLLRMFY